MSPYPHFRLVNFIIKDIRDGCIRLSLCISRKCQGGGYFRSEKKSLQIFGKGRSAFFWKCTRRIAYRHPPNQCYSHHQYSLDCYLSRGWSSMIVVFSMECDQASLLLVIWRLFLSLISSFLLLRCIFTTELVFCRFLFLGRNGYFHICSFPL